MICNDTKMTRILNYGLIGKEHKCDLKIIISWCNYHFDVVLSWQCLRYWTRFRLYILHRPCKFSSVLITWFSTNHTLLYSNLSRTSRVNKISLPSKIFQQLRWPTYKIIIFFLWPNSIQQVLLLLFSWILSRVVHLSTLFGGTKEVTFWLRNYNLEQKEV